MQFIKGGFTGCREQWVDSAPCWAVPWREWGMEQTDEGSPHPIRAVTRVIWLMRCSSFDPGMTQAKYGLGVHFITGLHYEKSHLREKTPLRPSYLHIRTSYTDSRVSLYWIGAPGDLFPYILLLIMRLCNKVKNKWIMHYLANFLWEYMALFMNNRLLSPCQWNSEKISSRSWRTCPLWSLLGTNTALNILDFLLHNTHVNSWVPRRYMILKMLNFSLLIGVFESPYDDALWWMTWDLIGQHWFR